MITLSPVLLALALTFPQGKSPDLSPGSSSIVPQEVFPKINHAPQAPMDYLSWRGWGYLQGAPAVAPDVYDSVGDWTEVKNRIDSLKSGKASIWRLKVVIFTRTESDDRDASGVLREHRATIESVQLARVQSAIDRFVGWVSQKFDGRVAVVPDIQIETEWMRDSGQTDGTLFGAPFIRKYLEARINGGTYESEDKIFRGPFHSAFYILAGAGPSLPVTTTVDMTPVAGFFSLPVDLTGSPASLDNLIRSTWLSQVEIRAKELGFKGTTLSKSSVASEDPWPIASSLDEPAPQTYLSRLGSSLELWPTGADPKEVKVYRLPETDASIVADPDRGQVLKITESAGYRTGGLALPNRTDGIPLATVAETPTLSFEVKTASYDPIAIRIESSDGKSAYVSVGADPKLVSPMNAIPLVAEAVVPNGKWQKISVNLTDLAQKAGISKIARLSIEPSPNARLAGKLRPDPIEYEFNDFHFSTDAGNPPLANVVSDAASDDPEARASFAAQAKTPGPELAALLKDKDGLVRLNATVAYTRFKDPSVEASLISNSLDLDPEVSAEALTALMNEGSDTALAVVRRSVRVALFDYDKQVAARLLAQTKDPRMVDDVSLLFNNRSWVARLSGVESLAMISSPSSDASRLVFLRSVDPEIKLAVTRNADPDKDDDVSKLLWSAVNEPSDMVRAASNIKLIESTVAANRTEGYKGVHDDSRYVRLVVLEYLAAHPKEENRNALRLAVTDKSELVRAAALNGFIALDGPVSTDEIANVMDDVDPRVQMKLIELAKKKAIKLPQKTMDAMASSPATEVAVAVKGLGN
ncbi:MAG: hypothetical protein P4L46_25710 [Fimbriimonas sp.]|nr:hypothetical protein [Fimbriimonas sp.]